MYVSKSLCTEKARLPASLNSFRSLTKVTEINWKEKAWYHRLRSPGSIVLSIYHASLPRHLYCNYYQIADLSIANYLILEALLLVHSMVFLLDTLPLLSLPSTTFLFLILLCFHAKYILLISMLSSCLYSFSLSSFFTFILPSLASSLRCLYCNYW